MVIDFNNNLLFFTGTDNGQMLTLDDGNNLMFIGPTHATPFGIWNATPYSGAALHIGPRAEGANHRVLIESNSHADGGILSEIFLSDRNAATTLKNVAISLMTVHAAAPDLVFFTNGTGNHTDGSESLRLVGADQSAIFQQGVAMGGQVSVGSTTIGSHALDVTGDAGITTDLYLFGVAAAAGVAGKVYADPITHALFVSV